MWILLTIKIVTDMQFNFITAHGSYYILTIKLNGTIYDIDLRNLPFNTRAEICSSCGHFHT